MKIEVSYNPKSTQGEIDITIDPDYAPYFGNLVENENKHSFSMDLRDNLVYNNETHDYDSLSDMDNVTIWEWFKVQAENMTPRKFGEEVSRCIKNLLEVMGYVVMGTRASDHWNTLQDSYNETKDSVEKYLSIVNDIKNTIHSFNLPRLSRD